VYHFGDGTGGRDGWQGGPVVLVLAARQQEGARMKQPLSGILVALILFGTVFASPANIASGQVTDEELGCKPSENADEYNLPNVDATGETRPVSLSAASRKAAFNFVLPAGPAQALTVYVGDQWYDLDLALYPKGSCKAAYAWQVKAAAISQRSERRVMQFVRPDEQILKKVVPGAYRLVVAHKWHTMPAFASDFDPSRGFTVRIARTAEMCGLMPDNTAMHPAMFEPDVPDSVKENLRDVRMRPEDALYQLGMTIGPDAPDQFAFMSFNAIISPPYTDLFDFEWYIDGKRVGDETATTMMAVPDLAKPVGAFEHTHEVKVIAKGVREYKDPTDPQYNHLPLSDRGGRLESSCSFTVVEKR